MTRLGRIVVVTEKQRGATVLSRLECSGLSAARATPWGLFLVSAGASPLGGDELSTELLISKGSELLVRSIAATLARRGAITGSTSLSTVRAVVEDDAQLVFVPEPGVACGGSIHRSTVTIELAPTAKLYWRDEVVLGRVDENAGTWWSERSISIGDRALLVSELGLGPGAPLWTSSNVVNSARVLSTLVLVYPGLNKVTPDTVVNEDAVGGRFPLAGSGVEVLALGSSLEICRELVARLAEPVLALATCDTNFWDVLKSA